MVKEAYEEQDVSSVLIRGGRVEGVFDDIQRFTDISMT